MNEADLILKLTEKLEELKNNLSSLSAKKEIFNNHLDNCNKIIGHINEEMENPDYIVEVDLDKMFNEINFNDNKILAKLKGYQFLAKSDGYNWDENQKRETIEIIKNIREMILKNQNDLNEEEEYFNTEIIILESVIDKLKNNKIDNECYKFLYDYLMSDEENLENNLELFMRLSLNYNNSVIIQQDLDEEIEEDVIEEITITNLDFEKVKEIFNKYGYDFLDFSDEIDSSSCTKIDNEVVSPRKYLLKLSTYENIEEILNILRENNIKLDLKKYSTQLSIMFVLSNAQIIDNIINNINEDIMGKDDYSLNEIFNIYIKSPSIFVRGKKRCVTKKYKEREIEDGSPKKETEKNVVPGAFDNYIENRKMFIDLGFSIIKIIENCITVLEFNNKTVRQNIEVLETYGITKNEYANSLSSLSVDTRRIPYVIDRFIELGRIGEINEQLILWGYEHVKYNLSRIKNKDIDLRKIMYRIINALNAGANISTIFNIQGNGKQKMALFSARLSNYPDDGIYIGKEKVNLGTFNPKDKSLKDIDFENTKIPFNNNLFSNYYVRQLEKFKVNDLCYNFNGVIISRPKALRNINILLRYGKVNSNNVLYALTKDSILTSEQCRKILSCLYYILNADSMNRTGGYRK